LTRTAKRELNKPVLDAVQTFQRLGFAARHLYGPQSKTEDRILLDGIQSSFVLSIRPTETGSDDAYYDWSWSCHVASHVEILRDVVQVRRWNEPGTIKRYTLPSVLRSAPEFIARLEQPGLPRSGTVIHRALFLLQLVRALLRDNGTDDTMSLRIFHELLSCAAIARNTHRTEWLEASTLEECVQTVGRSSELLKAHASLPLRHVQRRFLDTDPESGRQLDPSLVLRHAAGPLYQEAHLLLDQPAPQQSFSFHTPRPARGQAQPHTDAHFTPPGLARVLAEKAIYSFLEGASPPRKITIFDPACGSGAFLCEAFSWANEQEPLEFDLELQGKDVSLRAVLMAELAMGDLDFNRKISYKVSQGDSLSDKWPESDIILMNPPFVSWEGLTPQQKSSLETIVGVGNARPDLAMAFAMLALQCLTPGGVLATVLPSSLLETRSGSTWRTQISEHAEILTIGRFRGNDIFRTAMVEPAILIVKKKSSASTEMQHRSVQMLLSSPGAADAALRALRRGNPLQGERAGYDFYSMQLDATPGEHWLPRPRRLHDLVLRLRDAMNCNVDKLFNVHQGIRGGAKDVFLISTEEYNDLPTEEKRYFRPHAGNKTIQWGRLLKEEFLFYPYDANGLIIESEAELEQKLKTYFESKLKPARDRLLSRASNRGQWWGLSEHRGWLRERHPKLLSSYFGGVGKFSFDPDGEFVIGQGFGWLFQPEVLDRANISIQEDDDKFSDIDELTREFAPVYVALLNSRRFEQLLSYYSYSVMGGQFDLSTRYVSKIPIPDLISPGTVASEVVSSLRIAGEQILAGQWSGGQKDLDRLVEESYQIPRSQWPDDSSSVS